jgi:nitrate/nitrite-specific signal transduction histidine kinase
VVDVLFGIRWGSLQAKIIAWSFVPTAIILAAVALVTFFAYQQVTEELVIERDQELTRLAASQLSTDLTTYVDLLDDLARTPDLYQGDQTAQRDALRRASNRLAVFDGGVVVLDTFGTVLAADPEEVTLLGNDWSDRPCYMEVLRAQVTGGSESVFSGVQRKGAQDAPVVCAATPIKGQQGEFLGVIAGMFRLSATGASAFYGDVVKLRIGESGQVYLVDGEGQVIYHSEPEFIGADFSAESAVQQALNRQTDAVRTRDLEDRDIVASYAPIPGTPWALVVEESWASLTAGSRSYQSSLLVLLGLGIAVPIVVVALGVRRITEPITELIGAAQDVASGNFGQSITAHTGDEIEELAKQFNIMSAELQESYANLERRVADRTRDLAALNAIATTVSRSLDLEEILDEALDKTLEVMEVEAGGIYLLDEVTRTLRIAAHQGFHPHFIDEIDNLEVGEGFSGRVVESGQPIVIDDVSADSRLTRAVVRNEHLHALAIAPLSSKAQVLGTLFALTRGYREFSDQDVQLLTSIGNQVGVALENARFFEREQRRNEQFRVMSEVSRQITSILDVDDLLTAIVRLLKEAFGHYLVTIGLIEDSQLVFRAGVKTGWSQPQFLPASLPVGGEGITAWVAATGEPLLAPDVSRDPHFLFWPDAAETRSELAVPLKTKTAILGVLNVESDQPNAFDESDMEVLQLLANQAAIAIVNARNYERAQDAAILEERGRLARELHDAVTQTLFSASLIAETLPALWESDPAEGQDLLRSLRQLTRGALAEMRTLLMELRPGALVEANLDDLLRQLADGVTGRTGIPVTVALEGPGALPPDVQVAMYRIAQEALNNVVKHSGATHVSVGLCGATRRAGETGWVELRVCDDGRGFDPSSVSPESMGLEIMRERAEATGATVTIQTQLDCGTQVVVVWEEP